MTSPTSSPSVQLTSPFGFGASPALSEPSSIISPIPSPPVSLMAQIPSLGLTAGMRVSISQNRVISVLSQSSPSSDSSSGSTPDISSEASTPKANPVKFTSIPASRQTLLRAVAVKPDSSQLSISSLSLDVDSPSSTPRALAMPLYEVPKIGSDGIRMYEEPSMTLADQRGFRRLNIIIDGDTEELEIDVSAEKTIQANAHNAIERLGELEVEIAIAKEIREEAEAGFKAIKENQMLFLVAMRLFEKVPNEHEIINGARVTDTIDEHLKKDYLKIKELVSKTPNEKAILDVEVALKEIELQDDFDALVEEINSNGFPEEMIGKPVSGSLILYINSRLS